jgi:hypothetical protein
VSGRLAVSVAFAALAIVAIAWLAVDRHPPEWDHANHLERAVRCARDLDEGNVEAVIARSAFYPPVVPCLAGLAGRLVPSDVAAAQGVMLAFLALGMAAVYAVGRARVGETAGALAAVLFGAAPFVVFNTVRFQLDLPLASVVAIVCWLALKSDGFASRGWSLVLGAVAGVGLLVKPPFPVYVLPLAIWALARGRVATRAVNVGLATLTALAVSLAWYGPRLTGLPAQIANRSFKQAAESGHPDPFSWAALTIYPSTLPMFFGAAATALFAAGVLVAVRRRRGYELVGALVPFAIFLLIQNKNARYTLPILPLASVMAAGVVLELRPRVRAVVVGATLAVVALQVSATAFAVPPRLTIPGTDLAAAIPAPPRAADWHHREVLDAIARHAGAARDVRTVSIVPNHPLFSTSNFRYYAVRDGRPLRVTRAWDEVPFAVDYMVLKTGDVGPPWTEPRIRRTMARLTDDPALARAFPVIAELPLPDGTVATVRARDLAAGVDAPPASLAAALEAGVRARLADFARDAEGLTVRVDHDAAIVRGHVRRLEIAARRAVIGELRRPRAAVLAVQDLRLVIDEPLVNPWSLLDGRFEPLDARRIRLAQATIGAEALHAFLAGLKGFARTTVRLEHEALGFAVELPGPDVRARLRVRAAPDRPFALAPEDVRVAGLPVPAFLVGWVFRNLDPSARLGDRLPVPVEVAPVRVTPGAIRIADP